MRAGLSVSVCRHWHQTLCKPLQSEMMSWSVSICALRAVSFHHYTHLLHALVTSVTPRVFIFEDSAKMMNGTCPLFTERSNTKIMSMYKELSVKSRVRGDFHARFCERVRVKLPRSTRPCPFEIVRNGVYNC